MADTPWAGRAAAVLAEAGLPEVPLGSVWTGSGAGVVLLDERCPGVDAALVREVVAAAVGAVVVAVRPVTDTVKALQEGYVGPTVERDGLVAVCAPVVVPGELVGAVAPTEGPVDLVALVAGLSGSGVPVVHVEAPAGARRLADADELALL